MFVNEKMRGFSMLEVLVAFSITAMVLGVIYQIYAKGTTIALVGEEYALAVNIAESKLAELGRSEILDTFEYHGSEHDKYHWSVSIKDYDDEIASQFNITLRLKSISIEVTWESYGKQRSMHLNTLRPSVET